MVDPVFTVLVKHKKCHAHLWSRFFFFPSVKKRTFYAALPIFVFSSTPSNFEFLLYPNKYPKTKTKHILHKVKKQKIPLTTNGSLLEISTIDTHAKMIFENISKLEDETTGFDEQEFNNLKTSINEKQMSLSQIDQQIGGISEKISKGEEQINLIEKAVVELKIVKEYVTNLNEIQMNIFS